MMHFRGHGRIASLAWWTLLAALATSYVVIFAGLLGEVSAAVVSLGSFSGAMIGCLAALVYLAAAMRDTHAAHGT